MTAAFDYDEAGGEAGWATSCRTEGGKHHINTYGYCYWCGMSKAEVEVNKLRDLLRWRDAWGEPPAEHGNYLVQRYEYYGVAKLMVLHWNGKWPLLAISHWRPISPSPGE